MTQPCPVCATDHTGRQYCDIPIYVRPDDHQRGPYRYRPCSECGRDWWTLCQDNTLEMCCNCSAIRTRGHMAGNHAGSKTAEGTGTVDGNGART